ncbi:MAG: D-alanyl-D-alanine carboxypeptidase [Alphaproteobacteria bacterium]|nr:D-alanyl-D-alanine carboxypeptidase [Alphaproteobacteria bacterium]MDX5367775.1 D-alanyl-D-alanine carboxypeptidase [Alphaproteobacteria bacterium]MDX5462658.1 D-alanyl-D-alanine carboxypeptidase [Alphaproteobacteria bacterium]
MRRFWGVLAVLCAILAGVAGLPQAAHAEKYASIVMDADTGRVLHARNADAKRYPASLTKMMTLYLLFEALQERRVRLSTPIRVSGFAAGEPPSKLGLKPGETIEVEDAIRALIVKSANDVATAVGEHLGGSEKGFAKVMTRKARELGMSRTTFRNAHGLPDRAQQTTARDIATLAQRLMTDFPQYYRYFASETFVFRGVTHRTHNRFLTGFEGADGLKTGYINASGFNLASSAKRKGRHLVGVVFGGRTSRSRDAHMVDLMSEAFARIPAAPTHQRLAADERPVPRTRPEIPDTMRAIASVATPEPNPVRGVPLPRSKDRDGLTDLIGTLAANGEMGSRDGPEMSDGWTIQIGAFRTPDAAQNHAETVRAAYPNMVGLARTEVVPLQERGRSLFRSRLVGFTETAAAQTCSTLSRRAIECVLIAPDGTLNVAEY